MWVVLLPCEPASKAAASVSGIETTTLSAGRPNSAAAICLTPVAIAPDPFSVAAVNTPRVPSLFNLSVAEPGIGFVNHMQAAIPTPRLGPRPNSAHGVICSTASKASERIPASSST